MKRLNKIDKLLKKYKDKTDERFFYEVIEGEEYKPVLAVKADVVVDVGALAGEFSVYIYPNAKKIYAIEPNPEYYAELVENIKEFGLDKIKPFNIALSNYNGEGNFKMDNNRGASRLGEDGKEKVVVKTLATFIKENKIKRINILKIDIEGEEETVFLSRDFLEVENIIDFIIGEHIGGNQVLIKLGFKPTKYKQNIFWTKL